MPRIAGSIDVRKSEAILDAATDLLAERGLAVSMEEIARRAGVSKQTVYNHFGSKVDIARAMATRRADAVTAPLLNAAPTDDPEGVLEQYGRRVLEKISDPKHCAAMRAMISASADSDLAKAVFEAGPLQSRRRLADYLDAATRAGRLAVDDPSQAAEIFAGMLTGQRTARIVFGLSLLETVEAREAYARACAQRFVKAYAA